ncbi:hypothetical protein FACS189494_05550 [Spirochaetia bacterium]|nr:hypothetical protein FACS189494_05550 [Spirochaetia bacterium]
MSSDNIYSISIGRENCDINIPNQKVSRHHADIRVEVQTGQIKYFFKDTSSNGTLIDGVKVHNGEIEIYPEYNTEIFLAGSVELKWELVENTLRKKQFSYNNNANLNAIIHTPSINQAEYQKVSSPVSQTPLPVAQKNKKILPIIASILILSIIVAIIFFTNETGRVESKMEAIYQQKWSNSVILRGVHLNKISNRYYQGIVQYSFSNLPDTVNTQNIQVTTHSDDSVVFTDFWFLNK